MCIFLCYYTNRKIFERMLDQFYFGVNNSIKHDVLVKTENEG